MLTGLRRVAVFVATIVLVYLLAAVAGGLISNGNPARGGEYRVGLVIGPIHTDLLIPLTPAVRSRLALVTAAGVPLDLPGAEWLLIGWGAHDFYTTAGTYADITAQATWRGVTGDSAVLRLDAIGHIADFGGISQIALDAVQFAALLNIIDATFQRDAAGNPVVIDHPGFTASDQFFAANGHFNILHTCNVWVGEVMAAAGIPFGRWTPTPYAMRLSLWRFHGT